jgi:hypothetical protein
MANRHVQFGKDDAPWAIADDAPDPHDRGEGHDRASRGTTSSTATAGVTTMDMGRPIDHKGRVGRLLHPFGDDDIISRSFTV